MADVYILEAHRRKGLSKWLLKEIIEHPQLQGLRRIVLATRDAHSIAAPIYAGRKTSKGTIAHEN